MRYLAETMLQPSLKLGYLRKKNKTMNEKFMNHSIV